MYQAPTRGTAALTIAAVALIMPGVAGTHIARAFPDNRTSPDAARIADEEAFVGLARRCQWPARRCDSVMPSG